MEKDLLHFYVYVYLDPRKPGKFKYGEYEFDYEPFYVGKGEGIRLKGHLKEYNLENDGNRLKVNKIKKIIKETGNKPIIIKYKEKMEEQESLNIETKMIKIIGRIDLGTGPLTNLTNGGEGLTGYIMSEERKEKLRILRSGLKLSKEVRKRMSLSQIERYKNWTEEERERFIDRCKSSFTEERRQEISERNNGDKNPNFGNKWSDEQKKKLSDYQKQNSNFVLNNPQKINPNRGEKTAFNKFIYLVYNLDGILLFKSFSFSEVKEKFEIKSVNLACKICNFLIYKNLLIRKFNKLNINNIEEKITDERIIQKMNNYKLKVKLGVDLRTNIIYKYLIYNESGLLEETYNLSEFCKRKGLNQRRISGKFKNDEFRYKGYIIKKHLVSLEDIL